MNYVKAFFVFFFFPLFVLKSAELSYYVQEEDIEKVVEILKTLPSEDKEMQQEKNSALLLACRAKKHDDLIKKQEIITQLIHSGASLSFEHNGEKALDIIKHHQVWYEQQGVLDQLTRLVTPREE